MMLRIITNIPITEDSDKVFSGNLLSFQEVSMQSIPLVIRTKS